MANRCYLYSTNVVPGPEAKSQGRKLVGIAEWSWEIPLVFKALLSGRPRPCPSSIWENPEEIALVGDYAAGVAKLERFLARIEHPAARPLAAEALEFLRRPESRNPYLVLEGGEIFDLEDRPLVEQNRALLAEIGKLEPAIEEVLLSLPRPPAPPRRPGGLLSRLFGGQPEAPVAPVPESDPLPAIEALGLGNWSHTLYFDFSAS